MQNDGIVIGSPSFKTPAVYGTQVTGNRIAGLTGEGISSGGTDTKRPILLLKTAIARNQLLLLGGNGIVFFGFCLDLDIQGNSLISTELLAKQNLATGVQLLAAINANFSDNRIEQWDQRRCKVKRPASAF